MVIYGIIHGPNDLNVFPIDGLQFTLKSDVILENGCTISTDTDVFIDLESIDYHPNGNIIDFRVKCESFTLDGEYPDYLCSNSILYDLVKNSYLSEIVLNNEVLDLKDKFKMTNSLEFCSGSHILHMKTNKAMIC